MKEYKNSLIILLAGAIAIWILFLMRRNPTVVAPVRNQPVAAISNVATGSQPSRAIPGTTVAPLSANGFKQAQTHVEQIKQRQDQDASLWQSPLLYYGKVVDESNQPISGVTVSYTANAMNAAREEVYNTGSVTSDDRGMFKVDGVNGIGLMVQLSHPNYYPYPENSTGFNKQSLPKKGYFPDSEENAELFRLHRKGHPVSLVHRTGGINVPVNGTPTALDFRGADYGQKIGQLVVEATGSPPPHYNQQPFDWDVKMTVPNGGLIEFTNEFDFVAPDTGYQTSIELAFPHDAPGWTDTVAKSYFVQLPSGFARLSVYVGAKQPFFFSVQYDYNPDGSTDLERAK